MLKRAWLSTVRKPSRTVIVGLILFAMANLVLAGVAIKGAVSESTDYAKSSLGGTIYLQPDMEKLRSAAQNQAQNQTGGTARIQITRPSITTAVADDLADSEYVKDYTYSLKSTANASGFSVVENDQTEMRGAFHRMADGTIMRNDNGETVDLPAFMQRGDINLEGINSYAFISGVKDNTISLADGKHFDEKTDDAAIISKDLADKNSLKVGDKITLTTTGDKSAVELSIIGIYDSTDDSSDANTIYMNIATAARFLNAEDFDDGKFSVENVQFFLTDARHKNAFISEAAAKHPELAEQNLTLTDDTSTYEQMVGPIESVGGFATTILVIVIVASVVIITLIVTINVKDRRYEMGVLLSLGARRSNIVGQVLTELVVVGTLAFALSIPTSTLLARAMGDGLLSQQIAMSQQESEQNYGRPSTGGMMRGGQNLTAGQMSAQGNTKPIDKIDVNASAGDYALLFGIGYLIIIASLIVPTANVLRFQPKTILTGKE
jgi:putative ABC transport system permease protein